MDDPRKAEKVPPPGLSVKNLFGRAKPASPAPPDPPAPSVNDFFGWALDSIQDGCLQGWVWDRREPNEPISIELRVNGVPVAETLANQFRPDLVGAGIGNGFHGFRLPIPTSLGESSIVGVDVCIPGHEGVLTGGSLQVDLSAFRPVTPSVSELFSWNLDRIEDECLEGWIWDQRFPNRPVSLELRVNGNPVAHTLANIFRPDLVKAGVGNGYHGFRLRIPASLTKSPTCQIKIGIPGYPGELAGGSLRIDTAVLQMSKAAMFFNRVVGDLSSLLRAPEERSSLAKDAVASTWRSRGNQQVLLQSTQKDGRPAPLVSRYSHFIHSRFRRYEVHQLQSSQTQMAHLIWFVTGYGPSRLPLRVPLSSLQIEFLNGRSDALAFPFPISRLMAYFLLQDRTPRFSIQTEDGHLRFCYWWATEKAPELGVEDCLVPEYVLSRLAGSTLHVRPPEFRVSEYMRLRWETFKEALVPEGVLGLSCASLVEAIREPWRLPYIHPSVGQYFLGKTNDHLGRSRLELLIEAAVTGPTLSEVGTVSDQSFLKSSALGQRFQDAAEKATQPQRARDDAGPVAEIPLRMIEGVTIFGPLAAVSGLGASTRRAVELLQRTGIPVFAKVVDLDNPSPRIAPDIAEPLPIGSATRINLLALNADTLPLAFAYLPGELFSHSYNIGFFYWELSTLHAAQELSLDLVDEIWVASEFCRELHSARASVPVVNVGSTVDFDTLRAAVPDREKWSRDAEAYSFLTSFDAFSFIERKNPLAVVNAFQRAFPLGSDFRVELIVKTQNQELSHGAERWQQLVEVCAQDPRIRIMNRTLSFEELVSLKASCDCYVSLHRSEGFGYGPLEAMALGKPVILTGYSGTRDFANEENAYPVRFRLVHLGPADYIYSSLEDQWAEPDVEHAAEIMRGLAANPEEGRNRGRIAKAFAEKSFSPEVISQKYKDRILQIQQQFLKDPN
jgi:glycosyltransferase involved in cell wall biosynthesis